MTTKKTPGRPAQRRDSIVSELRRRIVCGEFAPGAQLPARTEVERLYGASSVSVQAALDKLKRDGFVETRGRLGTFVAAAPPHLSTYPVIFSCVPHSPGWGRYYTALCNEAVALQQATGRRFPLYYGVEGPDSGEDYRRLVREVQAHRVAGLIFASVPTPLLGTPLLSEPEIPRVAVMTPTPLLTIPAVTTDHPDFFPRALDYLASRGRRRVAVLCPPGLLEQLAPITRAIEARGLTTRRCWAQGVHTAMPLAASHCMELLFSAAQHERPDALIITDDNLVEYATAGIIAAGVRVPDDLDIVAHCNFPWATPSAVPVRRLGFEVARVLQACINSIDAQRRGETPSPLTTIPAVFEDEVTAAQPAEENRFFPR